MGYRTAAFFGRFTSHRKNLGHLLRREFPAPTAAWRIGQQTLDGTRQRRFFLAAFDQHQPVEGCGPTAPPNTDGVSLATKLLGNGIVVVALKGQEDHIGPLRESLR